MAGIQLEASWLAAMADQFQQPYMRALKDFLQAEKRSGVSVFPPGHVNLTAWADQGKGWETFTDRVVELVNREREGVPFMLWGSYAQRKGAVIDGRRRY